MKQVLYLDDHERWHELARRDVGAEVVSTYSLEEAVSAYSQDYAVIVADVNLDTEKPYDKGGLEFVKYVREKDKNVPIVVCTNEKNLEQEAKDSGATHFVSKRNFYPELGDFVNGYLKC
jgi:CheY-like chemotaxis protein